MRKLHWWKEAKRIYTGDIHDAMEQLKHISSDYETKKQTLLAKVQDKIKILAIEPQAAVTLINGFLADIKTQREKMPDVQNDEQRMAVSRMEEQEKALETLKSDYEQLIALQALLDEAFNEVLVKQVKECENYEERALDYFERIEKVLDDKKAHQYYDTVENSLDNIRALIQYLIGPLALYIDATVGRIEVLVPKMKKESEELERKGIFVRILTAQEKAEHEAAARKKEEERLKALAQKKAQELWNSMPWWRKIIRLCRAVFYCSLALHCTRVVCYRRTF